MLAYALMLVSSSLAAIWLARRGTTRPAIRGPGPRRLSPVTRQHLNLFQGGQLNSEAVEASKASLRTLLARKAITEIEARLRPGTQYVIHIRALAELGGPEAGAILERQLARPLSDDPVEQSWYWIDLAHGLRLLNRSENLPALLACAQTAGALPLGHLFAAETVCHPGFPEMLRHPESTLGRAALRLLHQALEGLRAGVAARLVIDARLGEAVAAVWEHRCGADPLVIRILIEAMRQLTRSEHTLAKLLPDIAEREAFGWQMAHLAGIEAEVREDLRSAGPRLVRRLRQATPEERADILRSLCDLRFDAAAAVVPLAADPSFAHRALAVEALAYAPDRAVQSRLCAWAVQLLTNRRRSRWPWRRTVSPTCPQRQLLHALLRALRRHPSADAEAVMLWAYRSGDAADRLEVLKCLGWWEPVRRKEALALLNKARRIGQPEDRWAASAALARLGERRALNEFRLALTGDVGPRVLDTLRRVAEEGLTWLWPDLDRLADTEDAEVAFHAREAIERLREDVLPERGVHS